MTNYTRHYVPGGTYFFTARLQNPASDLLVSQIDLLRDATRICMKRWPFKIVGAVVLPNDLGAALAFAVGALGKAYEVCQLGKYCACDCASSYSVCAIFCLEKSAACAVVFVSDDRSAGNFGTSTTGN
jgi:hypothetical protein